MAKSKKKGKASRTKKSVDEKKAKKINPFDLVFQKRTGNQQNLFNSTKGHLAAASRKKGVENRQKTLGIEYKNFSKVNKIVDRRVAQKDYNLTTEQKAEKRFVLQRKKLFSARNLFNLDADDSQAEQTPNFSTNRPIEDDGQSDDGGELGPDLVAMANFGGGSFGDLLDGMDKEDRPKRRDVLANLIALSKQSKTMRKMEKDVQLDKTEDLNEIFGKLQDSGLFTTSRLTNKNSLQPSTVDDYDGLYRELQFANTPKEPTTDSQQKHCQSGANVSQVQQFAELLREYTELAEIPTTANITILGMLIPKMHILAKKKPVECAQQVLQMLADKRQQALNASSNSLGVSFSLVAFLQLVCELYCTASWIHPVTTPTLVFAMQVLSTTKLRSVFHCAQAMLLLSVFAKWIEQSKRYHPEAVAFLHDTLLLCVAESHRKQFTSKLFSVFEPQRQLLFLDNKTTMSSISPLSMANAFSEQQDKNETLLKLQTIRILVTVTVQYVQIYSSYTQSSSAICRPILEIVDCMPTEKYPSCLVASVEQLKSVLQSGCEGKSLIQMMVQTRKKEKIKQMTFLEPRVEQNFNPERPRNNGGKASKAFVSEKQMKQRLRKETRGAAKELRMDAKYIANLQQERNIKVSRERKEKTNRIMQSLQSQESEYKKRTAKKF